jgi:hypothetical protein
MGDSMHLECMNGGCKPTIRAVLVLAGTTAWPFEVAVGLMLDDQTAWGTCVEWVRG